MPACTVVGCRSRLSRQDVVEVVYTASTTLSVSTSCPLVLKLINLFLDIGVRDADLGAAEDQHLRHG